jgi:hypothetical protein
VLAMATDDFTNYYTDLLDGSYDCVDRFILNAIDAPGNRFQL